MNPAGKRTSFSPSSDSRIGSVRIGNSHDANAVTNTPATAAVHSTAFGTNLTLGTVHTALEGYVFLNVTLNVFVQFVGVLYIVSTYAELSP